MGLWGKYERHINIIAKIFIIIILLFICYRIIVYDAQINELRREISSIEASFSPGADDMPVHLGALPPVVNIAEPPSIIVNITGAINTPGVYTLDEGSRLIDLIYLAGGALADADMERVNQASHLQDASHIRIPFVNEYGDFSLANIVVDAGIAGTNTTGSQGSGLISINTATTGELEALPGIGPVIASNIVDFRDRNGPFNHIDDLLSVNRIGATLLEGIRHLIEL